MIGYILQPSDGATVAKIDITSYELPLETMQGVTGFVTFIGDLEMNYSQYVLKVEGVDQMFKISGAESQNDNLCKLTLGDTLEIIGITAIYNGTGSTIGYTPVIANITRTVEYQQAWMGDPEGYYVTITSRKPPNGADYVYSPKVVNLVTKGKSARDVLFNPDNALLRQIIDNTGLTVEDVALYESTSYSDIDYLPVLRGIQQTGNKVTCNYVDFPVCNIKYFIPSSGTYALYNGSYRTITYRNTIEGGGFEISATPVETVPESAKVYLLHGEYDFTTSVIVKPWNLEPYQNANVITDTIIRYVKVLNIDITPIGTDAAHITFEDGHSILKSETYDDDICTHLIIINNTYVKHLYLSVNGRITTAESTQAQGYTRTLTTDLTYEEAAADEFAKNKASHKIEFYSDKVLHIGQPVRLALKRGVLDTAISKVVLTSENNRYLYTCGELPTTVTDNLKANSWNYGARLPANPRKGQLFIQS